ncbi:MAG: phosphopantetheine adenylyltransferase [Thaumarchaeota archaeon]|nr:phosphopantetheine adenylyltransferase [Nitrososphaerota archaeon]
MRKYKTVATGGTFDHIHKGHEALLARSFELGDTVVIGVTSNSFASREGKSPDQSYEERVLGLKGLISSKFPGMKYIIAKLDDFFGPGIASSDVEAIVVTKETAARVPIANSLRAEKGYPPLKVEVVQFVLAKDGKPMSSTRIRRGEIDRDGRVLKQHGAETGPS